MFTIEKGVPIPSPAPGNHGGDRQRRYPFRKLDIGDSFLADDIAQRTLIQACARYQRMHGGKFVTRVVDGGVRCWRVE